MQNLGHSLYGIKVFSFFHGYRLGNKATENLEEISFMHVTINRAGSELLM